MKLNKHIIVLDTETISLGKRFIYDVGYIVAELKSDKYEPIEKRSFVVKQIFKNKELFMTAYYSEKRPLYTSMLKGKTAKQKHFGHILRAIRADMNKYNVTQIYAYNAPFDKGAFNFTTNHFKLTNPIKDIQWYDIQKVANTYIHKTRQYKDFVTEHGKETEKGYIQTNAETTYGSIINDPDYKEEHTGLQDCYIELSILNECVKLGYQNEPLDNKREFIPSENAKEYKVIKGEKTYSYKYNSMRNTKKGLVLN